MQAGSGERAASFHLAGDVGVVERALRLQGDDRCRRIGLVLLLDRRLHRAQPCSVHVVTPSLQRRGRSGPDPNNTVAKSLFLHGRHAGVSTTRPTILPARSSPWTALTSSSGRVATGTSGNPVRRTSSINSVISGTLPTYEPWTVSARIGIGGSGTVKSPP